MFLKIYGSLTVMPICTRPFWVCVWTCALSLAATQVDRDLVYMKKLDHYFSWVCFVYVFTRRKFCSSACFACCDESCCPLLILRRLLLKEYGKLFFLAVHNLLVFLNFDMQVDFKCWCFTSVISWIDFKFDNVTLQRMLFHEH